MKKQLAVLAFRREKLLEKIDAQRAEVMNISRHFQKPLAAADMGLKAVRYMRSHPALVTGCVAAFLALRRKGIAGLAQEMWRLLRLYPSTLPFGLKYLSFATRSPSEGCNTDVDH